MEGIVLMRTHIRTGKEQAPMKLASGVRRRLAAVLAVAAMGATGSALFAAPASAGTNCEGGYHCAFWYDNFTGARHRYFNSDNNFTDDKFDNYKYGTDGQGVVVNDNPWSASNSSSGGYYSKWFTDIGYSGGMLFCLAPGHSLGALATRQSSNGHWFNEVSSMQLTSNNPGGCY
jgi:hypothetical protein